jgi:DNA-binding response OmpR family regulator
MTEMRTTRNLWILDSGSESVLAYRNALGSKFSLKCFNSLSALKKEAKLSHKADLPLLICDVNLADGGVPEIDDMEIPTLVVSSCEERAVIRRCLDAGAIDYLCKPIKLAELIVKIERFFDSHQVSEPNVERATDNLITFSPSEFCLRRNEHLSAQLTAKEFQIFSVLDRAKGAQVSRMEIQKQIWKGISVSSKAFDVHLFHLRKKLYPIGAEVQFIQPDAYILVFRDEIAKGSSNQPRHSDLDSSLA